MNKFTEKFIEFSYSSQVELAVIFGMFFQFFLSPSKTWKIALTIIMSSFFIAIYLIPLIIDALMMNPTGAGAKALYAFSALLSMELLSILIVVLPEGFSVKLKKLLEIKDAN